MKRDIDITKQIKLLHELEQQEQLAFYNHADMEQNAIYESIVKVKKSILITLVSSYGSGTIAGFINNTRYEQIDKAVNKTLVYLFHAADETLHDLPVDNASIANLVKTCYKAKEKLVDGAMVPDIDINFTEE